MEIKITRDTMSETYFDALRIRNSVFVKEQHVPYALEVGNALEEASAIHFVIYEEKQAVGTVRLLPDLKPQTAIIQRMAILKSFRGQGYAVQLLENLLAFAKNTGQNSLLLHAQLSARGFYTKFGFVAVGKIFEEAGIQHITMKKSSIELFYFNKYETERFNSGTTSASNQGFFFNQILFRGDG